MKFTPFRHDSFAESATRFHARGLLDDPTPRVVECRTTETSLVLGSVQRFDVVDDAAARRRAVAVTRRRSGGGAVLVVPGEMVWFDVVVPADDPRFAEAAADVRASMTWIGRHVIASLAELGVGDVGMHDGPMRCTEWCRLVCFAGTAAGEVTLGGHKLIGISQRRTRAGSRFQCAVHTAWSPNLLLELLAPPKPEPAGLPEVATLDSTLASSLAGTLARTLTGG